VWPESDLNEWVRQDGYVELQWRRADDDVHRISVSAMSGTGFGGRGEGWTSEEHVRSFADRLGDYPLDDADLPTLKVASGRIELPPSSEIGLRVYPIGGEGSWAFRFVWRQKLGNRRPCGPSNTKLSG
jgi:hypothetical protein